MDLRIQEFVSKNKHKYVCYDNDDNHKMFDSKLINLIDDYLQEYPYAKNNEIEKVAKKVGVLSYKLKLGSICRNKAENINGINLKYKEKVY